jgi:alpha-L-fucosidase
MSEPESRRPAGKPLGDPPPWARISARLTGPRAWFRKARFGVFIHFGLYTLLGRGEDDHRQWDRDRYCHELMPKFNPAEFDAEQWVRQVLAAGARYVVLTAKHGEGFCLWDTKTTAAKVTNTPFCRDIVGELADACHRHSLRLGVYLATDGMSADAERRYGRRWA